MDENDDRIKLQQDSIGLQDRTTGIIAGLEKRLNETADGMNEIKNKIDQLEEKTGAITGLEKRLGAMKEELNETRDRIALFEEKMTEFLDHLDQLLRRMKHLEGMAGVTTGDDTVKFDSQGILKKILSDFLGEEKASQLIPEETVNDPVTLIRALKTSIGEFSHTNQESNPDTVEIMLQYADQVDSSDKTGIILTYSKDLRKILETGQAVLASIGKQKVKTRSIMEETKNLTRKWKDEIDVRSPEHGVPKVIELLTDLENVFI
ncbi:MAG: hypothetical protein ACFFD4_18710 [Candidatus Odinarchaeota archaeon]